MAEIYRTPEENESYLRMLEDARLNQTPEQIRQKERYRQQYHRDKADYIRWHSAQSRTRES